MNPTARPRKKFGLWHKKYRTCIMAKKSFTNPPQAKTKTPARQPSPEQIAQFTSGGAGTDKAEPIMRLSVDLPKELHTRFKIVCAKTGKKMSPEVIALIESHVAQLEATA